MKKALLYTIRPLEPNEIYFRQEMKLNEYSKRKNIQVIKKYSDIGYPAVNLRRPALLELMNHVKIEKIDFILFYGMEHFQRDVIRLQYILPMLKRYVDDILFIHDSSFGLERDEQRERA